MSSVESHHVESIGRQGKRMYEETSDELEQKEGRVDGYHDLYAGTLGPRHFLKKTHGCEKEEAWAMVPKVELK